MFVRKILKIITDPEGRFIMVNIELPVLCCFSLSNIYGPNDDDAQWMDIVTCPFDWDMEDR